MKRDTERKKLYQGKMHELKNRLNVHLSKELKGKLGTKARAALVNKGDSVKIMRGSYRGKSAKVAKVNHSGLVVYLEGITKKNAKGTEVLISFQPSNLMLTELNMTKERKGAFAVQETISSPRGENSSQTRSANLRPQTESPNVSANKKPAAQALKV